MSDTPVTTRSRDRLTILQQNTNKSDDCAHDLLQSTNEDIVAIQEPYVDFLGRTRALPQYRVIYPLRHLDLHATTPSRSLLLVNTSLRTDCH